MSLFRFAFRPPHLGRYPMEKIKSVDKPTTVINDDDVPRVPMRGSFFTRAKHGDLRKGCQNEYHRFGTKSPLAAAMDDVMTRLVPMQDGEIAGEQAVRTDNPIGLTEHIKSLCYFLNADIVGICEIPGYAWYSHDPNGEAITTRHKFAIVMLFDQGYETTEGSTGDDWISGAQSYAAHLKGQVTASVTANYIRRLGYAARCHSSKEGEVQQLPLMLLAGLGELCRIGELVLNPFLGPRAKVSVVTTDLTLIPDKPIDFGLQQFCSQCYKCARECPPRAISFGDKIMFNGYEIWKPDVETCTKYHIINHGGSTCARCIKTCPLNKSLRTDGPLLVRLAHWLGVHSALLRRLLTPVGIWLDDFLGLGERVRHQKWWLDIGYRNGRLFGPRVTNYRNLDPSKKKPTGHRVPLYPAEDLPPEDCSDPFPTDRKRALEKGMRASQAGPAARH